MKSSKNNREIALYSDARFMYIMIIGVTAAMVSVMIYSATTGNRIAARYAPLAQAATEIKLEAAMAHLWFEEIITGDTSVNIESVWAHLERSRRYAEAMLKGGQTSKGTSAPLKSPVLRQAIKKTIASIDAFKSVAEERLAAATGSGTGSDADQRFDAIFSRFIRTADDVETTLQKKMAEELKQFRLLQAFMILSVLAMAGGGGLVIRRYEALLIRDRELLQEKEENLRITLNSIGDAVIVADDAGIVIRLNPVAEALTGWTTPEARNRPLKEIFNIVDADTRKPAMDPVSQVIRSGMVVGLDDNTLLLSKTGKEYQIADSAAPIREEKGSIKGVVLVFRDITRRKQDEDSIRSSEKKFRLAFSTSPDAININRLADGTYLDINEGFTRIMGFSRDEVVGKTSLDMNIWKNSDDRQQAIGSLKKQGYLNNYEAEFVGRDGEVRIGLMSSRILEMNGEEVSLSVTKDITDRKHVEKTLKENEAKYRTLFEKSNDAIFIIDRVDGRYMDANNAALDLTGRSLPELKQLRVQDLAPQSAEVRQKIIKNTHETMELGRMVHHRPDGHSRSAIVSVVPLNKDQVIAIAKDITEELFREKQLRQSQKMEAIGTLAGGIAHDFNNILSGIFGYAHMIENNLEDPDNIKTNIGQVRKGAKRAADLVQQILTFSRQAEHRRNNFRLYLVVKEAVKFLRSSIPSSIEIKEEITTRRAVRADPTQVHQVIMNLCTNAYHAMRESGGSLTISLKDTVIEYDSSRPESGEYVPGEYLKLEITDTGSGMETDILERVFEPYFTTKKPGEGTGLGLAVVDGIVKRHNGFLKIQSEVGAGTCFQTFWPVAQTKSPGRLSGLKKQVRPIEGTEHILLVDDEPDILSTSKLLLERQGYKTTVALNPLAALDLFEKDPEGFDLVITDMTMPRMTGVEMAKKILGIRKEMPIILCTGYHDGLNESTALGEGIQKFIQKPVLPNVLYEAIRELLDGSGDMSRPPAGLQPPSA